MLLSSFSSSSDDCGKIQADSDWQWRRWWPSEWFDNVEGWRWRDSKIEESKNWTKLKQINKENETKKNCQNKLP